MTPDPIPGPRSEILDRIRRANGAASLAPSQREAAAAAWHTIPRTYRSAPSRSREAILALFEDRLRDYDAHVERCSSADVPFLLERLLARRGSPRMLVPAGFPGEWLPSRPPNTDASGLGTLDLDRFDGVVTGATLGIAETGTLVLQGVPGQGPRAATLVPDYHACVIRACDVVETVPEAIRLLEPTSNLPTTFVSGPSATADIEMTRIKGVHGPRFLDVLVVV